MLSYMQINKKVLWPVTSIRMFVLTNHRIDPNQIWEDGSLGSRYNRQFQSYPNKTPHRLIAASSGSIKPGSGVRILLSPYFLRSKSFYFAETPAKLHGDYHPWYPTIYFLKEIGCLCYVSLDHH